ncbi:WD40-repeat-containing domain protein [Suillus subalutaceus]|uniref:WD40-repeat-containing domain protein n=1 Tax=Suillus subalutaceus TaxID=48586 RepID=UPI001B8853BC|nr:WD40-repeat-containing domain protein [Suillus subalutaceus]KAG1874502.1 WD40-repeat-containing domain protein [Suillus subalutaceus]
MSKPSVSTAYISASTNRFNHAADASTSSVIACGSGKLIALWNTQDPDGRGVFQTLPGHNGLVTCIRFVAFDAFASADDKGTVRYWRLFGTEWRTTAIVQAHKKAISVLREFDHFLLTGSSDSSIKIWDVQRGDVDDEVKEFQTISLQGWYPLSIATGFLPSSEAIILAIGGTDRKVHIWTRSDGPFIRSVTLSGHEDWIRALAFRAPSTPNDPLVLASGSQDGTIRLWNVESFAKMQAQSQTHGKHSADDLSDDLLDAFEASLGDLGADAEEGGRQISLKRHILTVKSNSGTQQYSITFDALLIGHEAGITSLSWSASNASLLSTSTDSSVIIWAPSSIVSTAYSSSTSSIWINIQRFGDVGGQRLGGFTGGLWSNGGAEAMAWGWSGGWRRWRRIRSDGHGGAAGEEWEEVGAISGHSGAVKGLDWSPKGDYLVSVGLDQTTRIHGAITSSTPGQSIWHELSRPQVHGYDLMGAAWLGPWTFASVADEKVARVFEAPRNFVEEVRVLGVKDLAQSEVRTTPCYISRLLRKQKGDRPATASVPPLGLSNKAVSDDDAPSELDISRPRRRPFEGELASITLWPEIEKVFGHGYESITISASNSLDLLATACRATSPQHAVIRVYTTTGYQPFGVPLEGHSLTVTRIAFSPPNDKTHPYRYVPVAADKSHGRIIWDCAWSCEGDLFATASRDKTVKIWKESSGSAARWGAITTMKFEEAATAVAFCSVGADAQERWLAVGLETGEIKIYSSLMSTPDQWTPVLTIDSNLAHVDQINHLAWRATDNPSRKQLASCSEDGTLKVLIVQFEIN